MKEKISSTSKEFIEKAKLIHNGKYDYSKVKYKNNHTKVTIICPTHGEFEQIPSMHLKGQGCPKCGNIITSKKLTHTTKEFIEKARKVHGNKYNYNKVKYIDVKTKVIIICPIHGEFEQTPDNHINQKSGCPICALENSNYKQGIYNLKHPEKYEFNHNPIYRSSYELKAFEMIEEGLETSDFIQSWSYESVVIPYQHNTQLHNYYVDIKLNTKNGVYLIEIKPENKLHKPNFDYLLEEWEMNQAKWKAARKYCEFHHYQFKIWTEKELGL